MLVRTILPNLRYSCCKEVLCSYRSSLLLMSVSSRFPLRCHSCKSVDEDDDHHNDHHYILTVLESTQKPLLIDSSWRQSASSFVSSLMVACPSPKQQHKAAHQGAKSYSQLIRISTTSSLLW